jgi:DNA-binding NtrC family response regulator
MVDPTEPKAFELAGRLWGPRPEISEETPTGPGFCGIVGESPIMRELYRKIEMVAGTDVTVLIEGETGTGKNLVAQTLHEMSTRAASPFVSLNASNLQEQLFESELFGHVRGAFSGAHQDHEGLARAAQGGTLFIDEVGELSPSNQARLLRFLDTKEVRPVGSIRTHAVDARIVTATNRSLKERVKAGEFREDLFYRLRVVHVRVPAVRERLEDLPLLIRHFLQRYRREHGKELTGVSEEARAALLAHSWPGNVRELENEIERAVVMTPDGEEIDVPVLTEEIRCPGGRPAESSLGLREYRRQAERRLILATVRRCDWNVSAAARDLGVSRVGLTKKLKRLGIERPD